MNFPPDISVGHLYKIESYLEDCILKDHMSNIGGLTKKKEKEKWIDNDKPILFEYCIGKVVSAIFSLPFHTANSYRRVPHFVKWNGSTDRKNFRKARSVDVISKVYGYSVVIDISLNSRSEPQLSREWGSLSKHLKKEELINKGIPVIGVFIVPRISEKLWEIYSRGNRIKTVLLDVKNLARIYEVSQFGIPLQHAQILRYLNNLSYRLNNSRSRDDYQDSLNTFTKEFVRDFMRSSYDLFLAKKVYSVFLAKGRGKMGLSEIIDELKTEGQVKELVKFIDQKVKREEAIGKKLKRDLSRALDKYRLVILDALPTNGEPIYFKPECEDSKCEARVIESVC